MTADDEAAARPGRTGGRHRRRTRRAAGAASYVTAWLEALAGCCAPAVCGRSSGGSGRSKSAAGPGSAGAGSYRTGSARGRGARRCACPNSPPRWTRCWKPPASCRRTRRRWSLPHCNSCWRGRFRPWCCRAPMPTACPPRPSRRARSPTPSARGSACPREELGHAQGAALAQALHAPRIDVLVSAARDGGEDQQQPSPMLQLHWLEREQKRALPGALPGEKRRNAACRRWRRPARAARRAGRAHAAPGARWPCAHRRAALGQRLRACVSAHTASSHCGNCACGNRPRSTSTWTSATLAPGCTRTACSCSIPGWPNRPRPAEGARRERLDACAGQAARELALPADEFLPFQALWPGTAAT